MSPIDIFNLWNRGINSPGEDEVLTPARIEDYLRPRIKKNLIPLYINLMIYMGMQLTSIIFLVINLGIYKVNLPWLLVTIGMLMISFSALIYSFWILRNLLFDRKDTNLVERIQRKLNFFRREFEIWLWLCSASLVILPHAIVTNIDNVNGTYTIHNIKLFVTINLIMFFGIYLLNKISLLKTISDFKTYYTDLKNNALDLTIKKELWYKKYRKLITVSLIILLVILLVFLIIGIIKSVNRV